MGSLTIGESGPAGVDAVQTDAQIIPASVDGRETFADLFDRHFSTVHRYLARRVGVDLAEDLAAEVFPISFDRRDAYQMTSPESRPWLLGIATNLARQQWRRKKRPLRTLAAAGRDQLWRITLHGWWQGQRPKLNAALLLLPQLATAAVDRWA